MKNDLKTIIFEDASERRLDSIEISLKIYSIILREIRRMPKNINVFRTFFKKIDGYFSWFWLSDILDIPENKNIKIIIEDKSKTAYSFAQGLAKPEESKGYYSIILIIETPEQYIKTSNEFNNWFIQNIDKIFLDYKEIFVHEYTHINDFKKLKNTINDVYKKVTEKRINYDELLSDIKNIAEKIKQFPEDTNLKTELNTLKSNTLKLYKIWNTEYLNNSIETNAYFNQYMSSTIKQMNLLNKKNGLETVKQKFGNNPQEFANIFFASIPKNKTNYYSEKVKRNFLKKSAMMYELIINKLKRKL